MSAKTAIVTGGSRGLGKNMAIALAQKGVDVLITYNSKASEAGKVVDEIKAIGRKAAALQLDISNSTSFAEFFDRVRSTLNSEFNASHFDFLINNAGTGIHAPFAETTEAQFDEMVNIQLKGAFFLTQNSLGLLNDGGAIVNISSGLARFSLPGYSAYAAMKAAMEALTRYQAKELGERRIRVNIVAPGAIETDFGGGVVRDNEQMNAGIAAMTALGRVGLPDDIGGVVAFLCSDEARWINGQRLEVSGGIFL